MISENINKPEKGFIALITAIAITLILLVVTVTLNQTGFFTRSTLLDAEYKERSSALAEACVDAALLKLANDPGYTVTVPEPPIPVGSDSCSILLVTLAGGLNTIQTRAVFPEIPINQGAATNLEVVVDASDLSVVSWNEVASFP